MPRTTDIRNRARISRTDSPVTDRRMMAYTIAKREVVMMTAPVTSKPLFS
jgi:hypothetical protein